MEIFAKFLRFFSCSSGRKANDKEQMVCVYCGSVLRPGNHSVQLKPKVKTTPKILRLKRREEEGRPMGGYQRNMLDNYQKGTTSVVSYLECCFFSVSFFSKSLKPAASVMCIRQRAWVRDA